MGLDSVCVRARAHARARALDAAPPDYFSMAVAAASRSPAPGAERRERAVQALRGYDEDSAVLVVVDWMG